MHDHGDFAAARRGIDPTQFAAFAHEGRRQRAVAVLDLLGTVFARLSSARMGRRGLRRHPLAPPCGCGG